MGLHFWLLGIIFDLFFCPKNRLKERKGREGREGKGTERNGREGLLHGSEKFENFFVSEDLKSSKEETEYKLTFFYNSFNFC